MHKSSIGCSPEKAYRAWCPASAMLSEFRASGVDSMEMFNYNLPVFGGWFPGIGIDSIRATYLITRF